MQGELLRLLVIIAYARMTHIALFVYKHAYMIY